MPTNRHPVPTSTTDTADPAEDGEDAAMWRLFVSGLIMGVPLIYTIAFLMALPSTSALNAAAIAIIPAAFCGWFYGLLVPLALLPISETVARVPSVRLDVPEAIRPAPAEKNVSVVRPEP